MCGSFCTHEEVMKTLSDLAEEYRTIIPILSSETGSTDTRFGTAENLRKELSYITKNQKIIDSIVKAEPIGPGKLLDVLVVAPCTGNTLAKLAMGIADTPVTMAVKSHLRNERPVVVAISTNDGLGVAAKNIGELLSRKHYYFVPFRQDNPMDKPRSTVADMEQISETIDKALEGEQLQPILLAPSL